MSHGSRKKETPTSWEFIFHILLTDSERMNGTFENAKKKKSIYLKELLIILLWLCSCLENPRDGGAWWAAVYGVAQSRTRLKRLSSSSGIVRGNLKFKTRRNTSLWAREKSF